MVIIAFSRGKVYARGDRIADNGKIIGFYHLYYVVFLPIISYNKKYGGSL